MMLPRLFVVLSLCLTLAGCGGMAEMFEVEDPFAIPKPFDEASLAAWPVTARVHPITIFPVDGLAPADAERLQRAILERTKDSDVMAVAPGTLQPLSLRGRLRRTATSTRMDIARVSWEIVDANGQQAGRFEIQETWPRGDEALSLPEETAKAIADKTILALEPVIAPRQNLQTAGPGGLGTAAPAEAGELPVFIAVLQGAPGDGNKALHSALTAILEADPDVQIMTSRSKARVVIEGRVRLQRLSANEDKVELAWRVLDAKGKQLGEITQANSVPHGSLDGRWGDTALDAAHAAAGGIIDLFAQVEQSQASAQ